MMQKVLYYLDDGIEIMLLTMSFTATAYGLIEQVLPFLLKFLADEYDDTSTAVFAFVNDILTIVCIHNLV